MKGNLIILYGLRLVILFQFSFTAGSPLCSILYQPAAHGDTVSTAQAKAISKLPSDWLIYEEMSRYIEPVYKTNFT